MAGFVAGLLTSALVKIAVDKLSSALAEQAGLVSNFRKDLVDMKDTMESMAAVLKDAEQQSVRTESVRLWLKRLKDAALDISDMMDDYQDPETRTTEKMPGMFSFLTAAPKKKALANKMKSMRRELRKINEQGQNFNFTLSTGASLEQQHYDPRETTFGVNEAKIFGRDREKKEIIDILSSSHNQDGTMVLPVYGLGGMGKSTLAQLIYNDTQFKQYDHRVWVYVSEVFDLKKIGTSIISQLSTEGHQNIDALHMICRRLDKLLPGKYVLIVLDDIWEEDVLELEKLKAMLHVHREGSTVDVIVTTRSESIANKICTIGPHKLQPFKDDVCWDIIKRYSGFEGKANKEETEKIGLEIAKKCGGVALAAQALGYMLKSKDLHGWSEISNSDIWNESSEVDDPQHKKVLPSLKLSYERMLPMLRLCFSYCAIFPKGHDILEDDLVHQWVALDFIKKPSEGKECIKQLLRISFLQHSKLLSTSVKHVTRYTMHNLVHDLARSVIGDELIVIDAANKSNNASEQKNCRFALLTNYDGQTELSNILPKKVRAFHFSSSSKLRLHDGSFSFAKCLRILYFSGCPHIILPSSIGQLNQLRCLIAPNVQNKRLLEALAELSKLQYLNLRLVGGSGILKVPESLGALKNLVHLDMSGSSGITFLPESLGGLKSLVHLNISGCSEITIFSESLGELKSLVHLDMSRCDVITVLPESLGGLESLVKLHMSDCSEITVLPESLGALKSLVQLDMSGCFGIIVLPESLGGLKSLVHLDMSGCFGITVLPESLGRLKTLVHLDMSGCSGITVLPESLGGLKSLVHLKMSGCSGITVLPESFGGLKSLVHLDMSGCSGITVLPESLGRLKTLVHLDMSGCSGITVLPESPLGGLKSLVHLKMSGCSGITVLPESLGGLKSLVYLHMSGCYGITVLLESLGGLKSLMHLNMSGCSGITVLPESLGGLKSLVHLDMSGCSGITALPESLGQLKSLVHLDMSRCDGITVLPESLGGLKTLAHLDMSGCSRITVLPESLGGLKSLVHLKISGCSGITVLPESLGGLKSLVYLHMSGCYEITVLPESLGGLKSLVHLEMSGCFGITVLPESLGGLKSLEQLDMLGCSGITALPESLGELKSLVHLHMSCCYRITVLPESLSELKSLVHLHMPRCYGGAGKDAKMVLPQPTPQQMQQMQMKGMKLPPQFMGGKMPFPALGKDPKSVKLPPEDEFNDFDDVYDELDVLEHTIDNGNEKPNKLKLPVLQRVTENFSDKLRIGHGGCGEVYKGILPNGVIAVKRLFNRHTIDDKMFHQEVKSMMMVKHKNTVRLLGYCSHTEEEAVEKEGKPIMAQIRERLLCFEYISNGSLKNQIADELRGLEWHTRYQIIKGICEGLHHLHKEKQIIHMDLKPDNILLDEHMVPKITDFGLSRFDDKSQTTTVERLLTMGYCAPEYQHHGKRSSKSDIYSLGVIILELVTGSKENPSITKILRRWKHRWNKSAMATTLGYKQVATSLDVAQRCMKIDPADRPNIWDILSDLNKLDTANVHISGVTEYLDLEDMLGIEPLEMHLPIELNKEISFSIELTNDTNDYLAFRISTTSLHAYRVLPDKDIVPPRSKYSVTIALQALAKAPPHNCRKDEFSVQSTRVDKSFTTMDIAGGMFNEGHGKVVDEVNVMISLDAP